MSTDPHSIASESTSLSTFKLPCTLERPPPISDSVSRLSLAAIAPDLIDLPLPFIHHQLALQTEQMLAGLRELPVPDTLPRLGIPEVLTIEVPDSPSQNVEPLIYPTHVLAVSLPTGTSTSAPERDAPLTLVPIHGIVLAANCAAQILRPVPASAPTVDGDVDGPLILPVCPISLPSVHALLVLRTYIYTKRVDALFLDLIPLFDDDHHESLKIGDLESGSPSAEVRVFRLATRLAREPGFTLTHILECAWRVVDVWKTAWALGLEVQHHPEFWDTVDLAWEVVVHALNLVAAEADAEESA
ncbi:hypothetical protein B0H12DRAFT_1036919 [Mycena haematopus]|nr:hypothetical protein B0H12DRAFT_1036919 [Mycena haematopus]